MVETDGLTYHRTPFAQNVDLTRDQTHTAAGLTHLRFSHSQIKFQPAHVRAILRETVAQITRSGSLGGSSDQKAKIDG